MDPQPVELHRAYVWDCDHCGRENLIRVCEIDTDDAPADVRERMAAD